MNPMKNLKTEYTDYLNHRTPDLWNRISAGVDTQIAAGVKPGTGNTDIFMGIPKRHKHAAFYWKHLAVAVVVAGIIIPVSISIQRNSYKFGESDNASTATDSAVAMKSAAGYTSSVDSSDDAGAEASFAQEATDVATGDSNDTNAGAVFPDTAMADTAEAKESPGVLYTVTGVILSGPTDTSTMDTLYPMPQGFHYIVSLLSYN